MRASVVRELEMLGTHTYVQETIIDASDNPACRYLVSDTCVLLNKPLVSGAAVGWEG